METQKNTSSSVISCRSMQLGVLATSSHAISTGTMFSVYYRPRMSPSEFLIPYNEYMRSVKNKYSIGLRFRMKFEGEECPKQRFFKDYIRSTTTTKGTLRGLAMSRKCYKRYRVGHYMPTTTSTFPYSKPRMGNWSVLNEKQNKPESREVNIITKSNSDGKCMLLCVDLVKLSTESASPHVISPPEFVNSEQLSGPFKMMKRYWGLPMAGISIDGTKVVHMPKVGAYILQCIQDCGSNVKTGWHMKLLKSGDP
ncbi:hypothetical protein MKW98_031365, partial [Papaver atlanticum]